MFTIEQIQSAHSKVRSGADFPNYIADIKLLGVRAFETFVSDSHTIYFGKDKFQTISGSKYSPMIIESTSDKEIFIEHLKNHQQGNTDYFTFCKHCAETGIEKWVVDLNKMTCTYFNKAGQEILVEKVPSV